MSEIDGFSKLHIGIRSIAISDVVLTAFWFMILYFTMPHLTKVENLHIGIVASFCLSTVHLLTMSTTFIVFYFKNIKNRTKDSIPFEFTLITIMCLIPLCSSIFSELYCNISISFVIYLCAAWTILILVLGVLSKRFLNDKKDNFENDMHKIIE